MEKGKRETPFLTPKGQRDSTGTKVRLAYLQEAQGLFCLFVCLFHF